MVLFRGVLRVREGSWGLDEDEMHANYSPGLGGVQLSLLGDVMFVSSGIVA